MLCLLVLLTACGIAADPLETFQIVPGFTLERVACEPVIFDPVDLEFDEHGDAYVIEMPGYPFPKEPGKVIKLADQDGDGVYDTRTVFAQGFKLADAILPWRGGLLVASPPELVFVKDEDGDGTAERHQVLAKGFGFGNPQHNYNGLSYGLDNWIYAANGGNSGMVRFVEAEDQGLPFGWNDFRMDLDGRRAEITGPSSGGFELAFDPWGAHFGTHNLTHIQQMVFPARYFRDLPGVSADTLTNISDHEENGTARVYAIGVQETRVNHPEQSGYFSAACGIRYYGGGAFGPEHENSVFVCDAVLNLVHQDVLHDDGVAFRASRGTQQREFLASTDRAFRPVNLTVGPDGALYVVDMYREVIEHPEWIPDEIEAGLNLEAGKDKGRIYRITPSSGLPRVKPEFDRGNIAAVVAALGHPNQWWRTTAQRLLVEWKEETAMAPLRTLAQKADAPLARVHALWTLQGLRALRVEEVLRSLEDTDARVRTQGLHLAEVFLTAPEYGAGSTEYDAVSARILACTRSNNPRERAQALLTASVLWPTHAPEETALKTFYGAMAEEHREDLWHRAALHASVARMDTLHEGRIALHVFEHALPAPEQQTTAGTVDLLGRMAQCATRHGQLGALLTRLRGAHGLSEAQRAEVLLAMSEAAQENSLPDRTPLLDYAAKAGEAELPALLALQKSLGLPPTETQHARLAGAMGNAADQTLPEESRLNALALGAFLPYDERVETLFALLDSREPVAIQRAAMDQITREGSLAQAERLVERWRALGPQVRMKAADFLLYKRAHNPLLLSAIEDGRIPIGQLNLDLERRRFLLKSGDKDIRTRAEALFTDAGVVTRRDALEQMRPALALQGDAARGAVIFAEQCAKCHRFGEVGHDVAPSLTEIGRKSAETLMHDILDPNAVVEPRYLSYTVELADAALDEEDLISGIIVQEDSVSVTLRQAEGIDRVIPRARIAAMTTSGLSLMPEELEKAMDPQGFADLLAYLQRH
jgi:putative membrane-bound dehydrogenase-like protein